MVLPPPLGPSTHTDSPGSTAKLDVVEGRRRRRSRRPGVSAASRSRRCPSREGSGRQAGELRRATATAGPVGRRASRRGRGRRRPRPWRARARRDQPADARVSSRAVAAGTTKIAVTSRAPTAGSAATAAAATSPSRSRSARPGRQARARARRPGRSRRPTTRGPAGRGARRPARRPRRRRRGPRRSRPSRVPKSRRSTAEPDSNTSLARITPRASAATSSSAVPSPCSPRAAADALDAARVAERHRHARRRG